MTDAERAQIIAVQAAAERTVGQELERVKRHWLRFPASVRRLVLRHCQDIEEADRNRPM